MTSSDSQTSSTYHMERLARKLRANPDYLASVLFAYQQQEQLSETALAHRLSVESTQLVRLALCKRPNTQAPNFAEQIQQLASFVGASETALAQIVRQVEVLQTFINLSTSESATSTTATLSPASGLVAAARDRQEDDNAASESKHSSEDNEDS